MSDDDLIESIEELIAFNSNALSEDIGNNAFEYMKKQRSELPKKFFSFSNKSKKAFFMAGGSGAGKSETASRIARIEQVDILDTDEIRRFCPLYSGANSSLFQRAASKGISILIDYAFKNNLSFILDGNFAEYRLQRENITRAQKRDYSIEILFVYRDKLVAKEYTQKREKIEGRFVPDDVFERKFTDSIKTVNLILNEFEDISFRFVDLEARKILTGELARQRLEKLQCEAENRPTIVPLKTPPKPSEDCIVDDWDEGFSMR